MSVGLLTTPTFAAATTPTPAPPTGVTAGAGDGSATVRWVAPTANGTGPIVAYQVTAHPGGETQKAPGTSTTAVVAGLPNGVAQTFTVVASDKTSSSAPSAASNQVTPEHPGGQYHPLLPYRICDTRTGNPSSLSGLDLSQCDGRRLGPGESMSFKVAGTSPSGGVGAGVPSSGASAVVLNVTVTATTSSSYLSVWPTGSGRPNTSSLNWVAGQTVSNLLTVELGSAGQVSVFNFRGATQLVVDVEGYVLPSPSASAGRFTGLAPYRVCDTRPGDPSKLTGFDLSQCEGHTLGPSGQLPIQITGTNPSGASAGGVPSSGVTAVVLNITVTDTTASSYLTVWPTGSSRPNTSNLNWQPGQTRSSQVVVEVGPLGQVSVFNRGGAADVVVDVSGWFSASGSPPQGSYLTAVTGGRICDTRLDNPSRLSGLALTQCAGRALGPGSSLTIAAAGLAGVPGLGAQDPPLAVLLQVTVINPSAASFLTIWPAGAARPTTSSLDWSPGETVANQVVVDLGRGGRIALFNASGNTAVVVDVEGYFSGAVVNNPFPFTAANLIDPLNGITALSCAGASFCVAVDLVGNAATWNGNAWGPPTAIDPNGEGLSGISCPSPTFCAAVDLAGNALTWNGQAWTAPVSIEPDSSFTGVSCSSSSFCVAIDDNGNAVMWNGTSWSAPQSVGFPGIFLNAVSCASQQLCAVADLAGDVVFWTGSAWSLPQLVDPVTGGLLALSCPTNTYCVGVDGVGEQTTWSQGSWSQPAPIEPSNALYAVSCASPTFCVAGDGNGNVLTSQGGVWGSKQSIDPSGGGLVAISCPSASFCAAADADGYILTGTASGWSSPLPVDPNGGGLTAVSCSSATQCFATDNAGAEVSWDGSQWSPPLRVDPSSAGLSAISCPSGSFCVAVDRNGQAVTWNGSTWSQAAAIDPHGGGLTSVSCSSSLFCAAADAQGNAVIWNGATWTTPQAVDPQGGGLTAISCSSSSFCAAVDAQGSALVWDGRQWSSQLADPNGAGLTAVGCSDSNFCVAVDSDGNALTWDGVGWSQPQPIDPNGGGLASISCPSAQFCVTVDALGNALN